MAEPTNNIARIKQERLKEAARAHFAHAAPVKSKPQPHIPAARKDIARMPLRSRLPEAGTLVADEGVFLGQWKPVDDNGVSLGKIFNVYAAPEDLTREGPVPKLFSFDEANDLLAALKGWHGHDGAGYANEAEFRTALQNGEYHGEWIIPTRELLAGENTRGQKVFEDNLFARHNTGALKETFVESTSAANAAYYWSSTPGENPSSVWAAEFWPSDWTKGFGFYRANTRNHCRPVRLVEAKP